MADPQGMDVMCGAESSGGRGDWQKKLGESMEQWGAPASRELDSVDAPPPVGTVPQASFRKGTAAYEAMQNAAGWMHRDREVRCACGHLSLSVGAWLLPVHAVAGRRGDTALVAHGTAAWHVSH
jgi:hypothetical protein|eukprot:SAG25_NODE_261_length_10763_cov_3.334300_10_plen_124_part_00